MTYIEMYEKYKTCKDLLKDITDYIKCKDNPLQERFNLFNQVLHLLPKGKYLSDWCLTNRSSPAYDKNLVPGHHRGAIKVDLVLEWLLEDLYTGLPEEYYLKYGDNIPLEILFKESPSENKELYKIQLEAILQDCKSGVILDW